MEELPVGGPRRRAIPFRSSERIVRLATAASQTAALSSRLELYPTVLDAGRALKLGTARCLDLRAYGGGDAATDRQSLSSCRTHPRAASSGRLLRQTGSTGLGQLWGQRTGLLPSPVSTARPLVDGDAPGTVQHSHATGPARVARVEAARALEERLVVPVTEHRFLVLTVLSGISCGRRMRSWRRFPVTRNEPRSMLLAGMKAAAAALGARWRSCCRPTAAAPETVDWRRLQTPCGVPCGR